MSLQLIDTHSHIYDPQFDADRDEAVARARAAGVGRILLPAVDAESYGAMFALARQYPELCRPMMGLHPTSVNDNPRWREDLEQVARYLAAPPEGIRFCGVGEVGLDLYWSRDFLSQQQQALRFQVELSLQYGLPLVIHTRDAWDEMCALLDAFRGRGVRGILHSFCGTADHYRALKAAGGFLFGCPIWCSRPIRPTCRRCLTGASATKALTSDWSPAGWPKYTGRRPKRSLR